MTVCIAARSEGMLLLASDRMLTAGDVQYEPPVPKVLLLTSSLAIMYSGDANFHSEVVQELVVEVNRRVKAAPDDWLRVKDIAELYVKYHAAAKLKRAEASILAPLGLNVETYLERQPGMHSDLVNRIAADLINFAVPEVEVIVCGIDLRHGGALPSIYTIYNGEMSCADAVGFAAIGSGARHANSRFMLMRHSYRTPNGEALLVLQSAKMDAEVAPGVGTETDLWAFGPNVGQVYEIEGDLKQRLQMECRQLWEDDRARREKANEEMERFLAERRHNPPESQSKPPSAADETSTGDRPAGDTGKE